LAIFERIKHLRKPKVAISPKAAKAAKKRAEGWRSKNDMSDVIRSGDDQARDPRGQFLPGASGNPVGRPKGVVDKRTQLKEQLLGTLLPKAIQKLEAAIDKDERWAVELVVEYSLPKPRPVDPDEMNELEERLRDLERLAARRTV
jgi:hypothetical protein